MMARAKRSIEEIANKSDSDDDDYSDHPVRSARQAISRSKANAKSKRKAKPAKKRRRRSSDDILSSSDDLLSEIDEYSSHESEEEDLNAERNARGIVRRRAARNIPTYNVDDSNSGASEGQSEDDEIAEPGSPPKKKGSTILKLRVGALKRQANPEGENNANFPVTRRTTRRTRDPSEDIYALTNSGRHVETIERGTQSPEMEAKRRTRRGNRGTRSPSHAIVEETEAIAEAKQEEDMADTTAEIKGSQMEIQESAHGSFVDTTVESVNAEAEVIEEEGFIPESQNGDANQHGEDDDDDDEGPTTRRRSRQSRQQVSEEAEPAEPEGKESTQLRRSSRKKPPRSSQRRHDDEESDFEPEEEESNDEDDDISQSEKSNDSPKKGSQVQNDEDETSSRRPGLRKRKPHHRGESEGANDVAEELAEELEDLRSDRPRRRTQPEIIYEKPRRSRKDVDYRIIRPDLFLPIEEAENEVTESPSRRGRGGGSAWQRSLFPTYGPFGGGGPSAILAPPGAPAAAGGVESDSSDEEAIPQPRTPGAASGHVAGSGIVAPVQTHGADAMQGLSGTPANLGKIKDKQTLADADPLGVDVNVNFDSVGGLQGHIDQLKEMVSLPLLYPEIFQRFHIVPPRGVLFHGPPGTGKTLLARALANSVSSEERKVTFYMRKGADALSKWVGEAERQLRLLFEEARKTQPSIIFFDEIDGLAPVRSSKQEQIHASIVSTLLALMDGMDGRGQVIVIGATNRPDSIDPALRRPGRFDREFYFPLPNTEGRRAILDIHTRGWDPPLPDPIKDELAELTKGYGGADLRALCTEAALNAVQRRYPQIYRSNKKLLIDPKKIDVTPKDFMLAIKKIVPSSERSTSSGASPLPKVVEPLLRRPLAEIRRLLSEILPQTKRLTALEEAQYEDPQEAADFRRERLHQEFEMARIFRPRVLVRGSQGMGQQYLGAALLHHFEGLHVQAFDLATLLSDSTRSPEAAVIQLFAEVKRHKPSVIYIPNIQTWYETVGPTVISTFLSLLRSVPPMEPVLLLGVLETTAEGTDPTLLRNLFGFSKRNIYDISPPDHSARYEFFQKLVEYIETRPADFPDPERRKKRKLESLEVAPLPPPKRPPPPTKEQLKAQKKKDHQTLNLLKIRIQPIMDQIKKYKRFRTGVIDESQIRYLWEEEDPNIVTSDLPIEQRTTFRPFEKAYDKHGTLGLKEAVSGKFFYNLEIVTIEKRLSNGYYKRPKDFLADIKRIAKDARQLGDQERLLRANELLSNVEVDIATIEQTEPGLVAECEAVYQRELEREKIAIEKAKQAKEEETFASRPVANHSVPVGNTESTETSGPVVLGERFPDGEPKRPAQPTTPSRRSTVSFMTNGYRNGGGSEFNSLSNNVTTNSGDADGDTYMTNSDGHSVRDTQNSSFGPSAQPRPAYSHTAPSQQVRRESGISSLSQRGPMTPMAPGSQPNDYINEASTTQTTSGKKSSEQSSVPQFHTQSPPVTGYPDLTLYPDRISQEDHLPDTQQEFPNSQNSAPNGSQSQKQQPPVPLFDASNSREPSRLPQSHNDEDGSSEFILDPRHVEDLHTHLTQRTNGCSVEQLEQINTNLVDYIWLKRGEWDRNKVADGVRDTFNEVLDDILSMQEFGRGSRHAREQLSSSF